MSYTHTYTRHVDPRVYTGATHTYTHKTKHQVSPTRTPTRTYTRPELHVSTPLLKGGGRVARPAGRGGGRGAASLIASVLILGNPARRSRERLQDRPARNGEGRRTSGGLAAGAHGKRAATDTATTGDRGHCPQAVRGAPVMPVFDLALKRRSEHVPCRDRHRIIIVMRVA